MEVVSPYPNEIENFDNENMYPDLVFVVAGMAKPLHLHRKILATTSEYFRTTLKETKDLRLEWPYDTSNEVDRDALVKALRFCYGETLSVDTKKGECCAMIAALLRLQVTCLDDATALLINFATDEAKRNLATGVELLKACTEYKECCGTSQFSLDKKLAAIVLTKDNMHDHYREVVDECLMVLPADYLMVAEYGEPHTKCSEFCLRTKYVRCHSREMNLEEKQALIVKCDWSTLNSQELRELRLADIIDKDELLEAHEKALEYCEIENERANEMIKRLKTMEERVKELEKEKEKESEKVRKAEMEAGELRGRAERAEKVMEILVQECEEYKRRAENVEKEKEQSQNCTETPDTIVKVNRLYTMHYQN